MLFTFLDKELPRTFENVMEPLMTELYDLDYAFFTLLLKMYTDWPECPKRLFDHDLNQVSNAELLKWPIRFMF